MSLSMSSDDGPFVFGAYAAHLDRFAASAPAAEPDQPGASSASSDPLILDEPVAADPTDKVAC